jgi:flagellar hook protein FlgE
MTFRTALSGLNAAATDLNVTANNIANVATPGFKLSRAEFSDVFAVSTFGLARNAVGSGVRTAAVSQQFTQGNVEFTDNSLDLAISGGGFFRLSDRGAAVFSRAGNFSTDASGFVVNPAGHRLQVFPAIPGTDTFDTGRLVDLQLSSSESPPQATTAITVGTNLPAGAAQPANTPFDPLDPLSFNHTTSLTVFDSLGAAHITTLYYVKTPDDNQWEVYTFVDGPDNQVGGPDLVQYNQNGALDGDANQPPNGIITLPAYTPTNGAAPIEMTLNLGDSTQFGERFSVNELRQDGFTTGRLTSIEVSPTGVVFARFTNGQASSMGQVALAHFPNAQGLQEFGNNVWGETFESGQPLLGTAGSASLGLVQSGALEASNVDLTAQLVNMITAQRNFQANAQTISTFDQVTQTIINIR